MEVGVQHHTLAVLILEKKPLMPTSRMSKDLNYTTAEA
jgi:hypothetical protein